MQMATEPPIFKIVSSCNYALRLHQMTYAFDIKTPLLLQQEFFAENIKKNSDI